MGDSYYLQCIGKFTYNIKGPLNIQSCTQPSIKGEMITALNNSLIACVICLSVGFGSKELQPENGARKRRGRGRGRRKETLANKPLDN